jgi:hypothetical protein
MVILDRLDSFNDEKYPPKSDGLISLRKVAQRQTVLLARAEAEEGLSAPRFPSKVPAHRLLL